MTILLLVGTSSPVSILIVVDLPAPLGPDSPPIPRVNGKTEVIYGANGFAAADDGAAQGADEATGGLER